MRYDENYGYLHGDTTKCFYRHLKFDPLTANQRVWLSFGGEARLEYDVFNNEDWGRIGTGHNNFQLQRYDLHADLHFGNRLRIFAQLRSALENGRRDGPRPIDEDKLSIQNLFTDYTITRNHTDSLVIRAGRQELNYGAGRLISVREGPNARIYFTGGKLLYRNPTVSLDAFAMEADEFNPGVFDNKPTHQLNLWGAYATFGTNVFVHLDTYYIGSRNDHAVFDDGQGKDIRHTFGLRAWKSDKYFVYDIETAWQTGSFKKESVRAWTASFDVGYIFSDLAAKPAIGIRNDYISGDSRKGDGRLQTFNPVYPKGGYFGFDPQVGPVNLIDVHPYGSLLISPKFTLQVDVVLNWRYSLRDGIYRPSGYLNFSGSASDKRYIGTSYLGKISYNVNPFLSMDIGIQYFDTGPFIETELPVAKNAFFTNSRISYKF
ncbi:hypothetical protein HYN43_008870 [Mucilaginibacter celer]|uniref:Alginate export domain-containing protein n=2 Tax=Mucilaginibacter celer TaxID=2305508 RepID=A0A494VJY1_9SPHI|nr:hypothetical protein HYN43_008870 [Mucilaginibacter celer]